jgi:hypothetical protein
VRAQYAPASRDLDGKSFHPQSRVYYAAVLNASTHKTHKDKANAFVNWLTGDARTILQQAFYDSPTGAGQLHR